MEPRRRDGASTYLEVFILIGVAVGGSALVFSATTGYGRAAQGSAITLSQVTINQGTGQAVERMVVTNAGTTAFASFTISTVGIANAQFYVALTDVATGSPMVPTLSSGTTGDSSITETINVSPGQSILASVTFGTPAEFTVGQSYTIIVSSSGAQASALALALTA